MFSRICTYSEPSLFHRIRRTPVLPSLHTNLSLYMDFHWMFSPLKFILKSFFFEFQSAIAHLYISWFIIGSISLYSAVESPMGHQLHCAFICPNDIIAKMLNTSFAHSNHFTYSLIIENKRGFNWRASEPSETLSGGVQILAGAVYVYISICISTGRSFLPVLIHILIYTYTAPAQICTPPDSVSLASLARQLNPLLFSIIKL